MLRPFHIFPPPLPSNAARIHIFKVFRIWDSLGQLLLDYSLENRKRTGDALLIHFLSLRSALFLSPLLLGVDLAGENGSWVCLVVTELYFIALWLSIVVNRMGAGVRFGL